MNSQKIVRLPPWPLRVISGGLIVMQLLAPFSGQLVAQGIEVLLPARQAEIQLANAAIPPQESFKGYRAVPVLNPPSSGRYFSESPSDTEIFLSGILPLPLVPTLGTTGSDENRTLAIALTEFSQRKNVDDFSSISGFLKSHPQSAWRLSLLNGLGKLYRQAGYFSKALETWAEVWELAKGRSDLRSRNLADDSVSELAELNARIGRFDFLHQLFQELNGRPFVGSYQEKLSRAKEGLGLMEQQPGQAFLCGPYALAKIQTIETGSNASDPILSAMESTKKGTSLQQLKEVSAKMGMNYQPAKRGYDASIIIPSVIHWKVGHFAALVQERDGMYQVQDPTFGSDLWVTKAAINEESSGYFLIPSWRLPAGWSLASESEAASIWGKGNAGLGDSKSLRKSDQKCKPDCDPVGMASYNVHAMAMSLSISDTPIGYQPPRGPAINFTVTYNQREKENLGLQAFGNMGPSVNYSYLSYIRTNTASVTLYVRGGGQEDYTWATSGGSTLNYTTNHPDSHAWLTNNGVNGIQRFMTDGSTETFGRGLGNLFFLTQIVDPMGNTNVLQYDGFNRLATVVDAIGQTNFLYYGSTNISDTNLFYKITAFQDAYGRSAYFQYSSSGTNGALLTNITDVINISSGLTYSNGNFVSALTTPHGVTTFTSSVASDSSGITNAVIEVTDPNGNKERMEFDGYVVSNFLTDRDIWPTPSANWGDDTSDQRLRLKARNTYYWDKNAMKIAPRDYNQAKVFHWLHSGRDVGGGGTPVCSNVKESEKSPLEGRVWYHYPGQTTAMWDGSTTNSEPEVIQRVLDDGSNQLYQYQFNAQHKVTRFTDPTNRVTTFTYTNGGLDLIEVRQAVGTNSDLLARFMYNSQHLPLTAMDASGRTNSFAYNQYGQLTASTNGRGEVVSISYDSMGNPTNINSSGLITSFTYDGTNRVRTITDSQGFTITNEYDALDRLTKVSYPDGTYKQVIYRYLDPILARDRRGHWSATSYDALRRVRDVTDSAGRVTHFEWCNCGSLESITDPMGRVTAWLRDVQGRVTDKIYPDNTRKSYQYEIWSSRLKSVADAKGQQIIYSYYVDNNVKQLRYTNMFGFSTILASNLNFTYDSNYNRSVTLQDGTGTTTYRYNPVSNNTTLGAGRLASTSNSYTKALISYQYDELGRITNQTIDGVAKNLTYDALGRVTLVTNALGSFTNAYVTNTMQLSSVSYPNGQQSVLGYYGATNDERLQTIWHKNGAGTTISKFNYTYDADGQIATWTQQADLTSTNVFAVEYDPVDQMLGATLKNGVSQALLRQFVYSYDKAGNRLSEQIDMGVATANYNQLNQVTNRVNGGWTRFKGYLNETGTVKVAANGVTNAAAMSQWTNFLGYASTTNGSNYVSILASDFNTNGVTSNYWITVTNNGLAKTLAYDPNGNQVSSISATATNRYSWDSLNRLVGITNGTSISEFTYDGMGRRVRMVERTGSTTNSDRRFVWCGTELCEERDATGTNVTKRFFGSGEQISGTNYFFTQDHLGSIREMTDGSGTVRARYDYDPFGRRTKLSGDTDSDFGFTGHYFHQNSGCWLTLYRGYDPDLGRWLSRDPIEEGGGVNLYGFVGNDPINKIDPLGLWGIQFGGFNIGIGNPNLAFDGSSVQDIGEGASATMDGLIPFADPFSDNYDPCDKNLKRSKFLGRVAQTSLTSAAGSGLFSAGGKSLFWSGKGAAQVGATVFPGSVPLAATLGGRAVAAVEPFLSGGTSYALWRGASALYAANAQGIVPVVISGAPAAGKIVWMEIAIMNTLRNATPVLVYLP